MEKGRVSLYVAKERNENSFNLENRVLPVSTSPRSPIESLLATLLAPFSSLDRVELKGGRKEGGKGGTGQRVGGDLRVPEIRWGYPLSPLLVQARRDSQRFPL